MLRDILRNPNSLSYFMEFMDRRQRSMSVQFWLTVESFKIPLETVDSDSSGDEEEIIQDPSTLANVKEDIAMIHNLYFANAKTQSTLTSIPKKHVDVIRAFVLDRDPSIDSQRRVRRSVLLAQKQVEHDMEQDFEDFERSELWFRAVGDSAFTAIDSSAAPFPKEHDGDRPQSSSHSGRERRPLSPAAQAEAGSGVNSATISSSGTSGVHRTTSSISNRSVQTRSSIHTPSNIEVLMSPVPESASTEPARAPLFDDPEDEMQRNEEKRMEAIHAALTDIISLERQGEQQSAASSLHERKSSEPLFPSMRSTHSKRRATLDDILADGVADEDEREGSPDEHATFQPAAPGDLQLSYEIDRLGQNIAHLEAQHSMLETLIKKAELSGDAQELKLLRKSESAMTRELRELQFQKQQYEQQESANRLISDRTRVSIVNSTVAEEGGKQVVRYLVEVQQLAPDGSHASGWVVARRYNEFHNMHNKLKERYVLVKNLEFPGKALVTSLYGSFLDTRKQALDKYLQVHNILSLSFPRHTHRVYHLFSRLSWQFLWSVRVRN
jgi:sorting nexin-25